MAKQLVDPIPIARVHRQALLLDKIAIPGVAGIVRIFRVQLHHWPADHLMRRKMNLKTPLVVLSLLAFCIHCRRGVLKEQSEVVSSCFEISLAYLDSIYAARGVQVDTIYYWASTYFELNSDKYDDIDAELMKSRIEKGKYSYNKDIVRSKERFKPKVRYVIFKNINYSNTISTVELLYGTRDEDILSVIVIDNDRDLVICKSDLEYSVNCVF